MFSIVVSRMRCRLSLGAQEMWGVMRQFFAVRSGLSLRMGSVDTTSSPAAASLPLFSASATSRSLSSWPRALLSRIAPSFILAMLSLQIIPVFSAVRLQCRLMTSARAYSSSSGTYSAMALPLSLG